MLLLPLRRSQTSVPNFNCCSVLYCIIIVTPEVQFTYTPPRTQPCECAKYTGLSAHGRCLETGFKRGGQNTHAPPRSLHAGEGGGHSRVTGGTVISLSHLSISPTFPHSLSPFIITFCVYLWHLRYLLPSLSLFLLIFSFFLTPFLFFSILFSLTLLLYPSFTLLYSVQCTLHNILCRIVNCTIH